MYKGKSRWPFSDNISITILVVNFQPDIRYDHNRSIDKNYDTNKCKYDADEYKILNCMN